MIKTTLISCTALLLAACAAVEPPTRDQLGRAVRVRIEGREVPSITSADHFLFFTLLDPDGERVRIRVRASESTGAEGLSLAIASLIEQKCGFPSDLQLSGSVLPDRPECAADLHLPLDYDLDFTPGSFFVYRIDPDNRTQTADVAPEIWLGQSLWREPRYVELVPSDGPMLEISGRPPGYEKTR